MGKDVEAKAGVPLGKKTIENKLRDSVSEVPIREQMTFVGALDRAFSGGIYK